VKLVKLFLSYVSINIINASIPFFLLPILTTYLTPTDYGTLTNIDVIIRFTLPFILLGVNGAINTAYFRNERHTFPAYFKSGISINLIASILITCIFFVFSNFLNKITKVPQIWLLIIPTYCLLQSITTICQSLFQMQKKAVNYGIFLISLTIINFTVSILFVVVFKYNWQGRISGILISYIILSIVSLVYFNQKKLLSSSYNKEYINDILKFGIPLIPHLISGPLVQFSDRLFITHYSGLSNAGIYNVAYQIGTVINLITVGFNQAFVPYLYEKLKNIDLSGKKRIVKQSYALMLGYLIMAIMLWIVSPFIFKIFINSRYWEAQNYILPIALGSSFGGMYLLVTNYIFYTKKTYLLTIATISNGLTSVFLNSILVRKYGAQGAAITFMISNFLIFISVWIISSRIYKMPWIKKIQ